MDPDFDWSTPARVGPTPEQQATARAWRYGERGRPSHRPEVDPTVSHGRVCVAKSPDGITCGRAVNLVYANGWSDQVRAIRHNPRPYGRAGAA